MKLVTINNALLLKYTADSEVLQKSTRPYVLVVRLKYKDACYDFAVPIQMQVGIKNDGFLILFLSIYTHDS